MLLGNRLWPSLIVMSAVVCPEARGLLEAEPAQRAVEVLLLAVEELVLLESRLAEESFGAKRADKLSSFLLLFPG